MWRVFCSSIVRLVVGVFPAMQVPPLLPREGLNWSFVKCQNIDNCVIFLNIFRDCGIPASDPILSVATTGWVIAATGIPAITAKLNGDEGLSDASTSSR